MNCVVNVPWRTVSAAALALVMMGWNAGCDRKSSTDGSSPPGSSSTPTVQANQVEVIFAYGSEKKAWIDELTAAFNAGNHSIRDGRTIKVTARPMGSGEAIEEIISGRAQVHLISPASTAFITLGNAKWRAKNNTDLIVPTGSGGSFDNLVVSPVVLAMWKPMAEALGWPNKPIGWSDILALAASPKGWSMYGHPQWGSFKFGHTHPEYSNSGLISVLAEAYAGAGKARGLSSGDLESPELANFIEAIERSVVHYGSSTGFFADRMFDRGSSYLSAAVLYESLVIESYHRNRATEFPVVAIYPKEGTFWSDHPIGLVQREWVKDEQREAARIYADYLRAEPQQRKALAYGFRPGDTNIPLSSPIDPAFGVDPHEPRTALEAPRAQLIDQCIALWRQHKKHANLVVIFDTSGSMAEERKMPNARNGAAELIDLLDEQDTLSLLPFSTNFHWAGQQLHVKEARPAALKIVQSLVPGGNTALYDSISEGHRYLLRHAEPTQINAMVVLTDGEDTNSRLTLDQLIGQIRAAREQMPMRIFTIGYGSDARQDVLKTIADETDAKFFVGTPRNIREVFKEIATFF